MDRSGWLAFAWSATLIGAGLAATGAILVVQTTQLLVEQSAAEPPARPWFLQWGVLTIAAGALLIAMAAATTGFGWGRVRAKGRIATPSPPRTEQRDDDWLSAPPGFAMHPTTRRTGLVPLLGLSLLGLALLGLAVMVIHGGITALVEATRMDGQALGMAMWHATAIRFAGLPLAALGAFTVGITWGWSPVRVVVAMPATTWQAQD